MRILKYLAQFFRSSLFQILKKHTYKSQNTPFHTNNNFKGNNLHKNHYTNNSHKTIIQIDKHKAKDIITACIPKLFLKIFTIYKKFFIII